VRRGNEAGIWSARGIEDRFDKLGAFLGAEADHDVVGLGRTGLRVFFDAEFACHGWAEIEGMVRRCGRSFGVSVAKPWREINDS
jgi:hypothetical protein